MKKKWRVAWEWASGSRYSEDAVSGIAEYNRRFGPFHFCSSRGGDFRIHAIHSQSDVDGIIVYGVNREDGLQDVGWPRRVPIVSIEGSKSRITQWQVVPDDEAIGRLVAGEFVRRGFEHFAYCPLNEANPRLHPHDWDQARWRGFGAAVRAAGAEPLAYESAGAKRGPDERELNGPLTRWVQSLPKPIGIMAANDLRARELLLAAEAAGIKAPEEIAVVGVDNERWVATLSPSISSVELDGFRAGYMAMEMLHRRMEGNAAGPKVIRIPPRRLITRQSSDALAIKDPDVAAAMRFIAEHATAGINVAHVVEAVALSRRTLELRFHQALGRSILHHIRAAQIERAKLLLADPEIPLGRVAKVSGFSSAMALSKIFRRIAGTTPSAYRAGAQPAPPPS